MSRSGVDMQSRTIYSDDTVMDDGTSKASQACLPCRKQKRKCDKSLPACSLCSRMGRTCDYTEVQPPPTSEDLMSMHQKIIELEQRLNQQTNNAALPTPPAVGTGLTIPVQQDLTSHVPLWMPPQNKCPSALFLDIDCFKYASLRVPKPSVDIPADVLEILSNTNSLQQAVNEYFSTVHCWMPIISKKRMNLGHSLRDGGPDLAMLFLAMKLVASQPVSGIASTDDPLYIASKRFLSLLESGGMVSIIHLQAMVLVAIYEMGHSIYPAAWMTVAACTRYADMLGLPNYQSACLVLGQCSTWTEIEERRRVWWAIFVLDRAICLGNKRRTLAPEPGPNDALPMDDRAWDDGDVARALQSPVSVAFTEPRGPFARTCQASILVSRVQSHIRHTLSKHRAHDPEPFSLDDVDKLLDDIGDLSAVISSEMSIAANNPETTTSFNSPYTNPGTAPPTIFSQTSAATQSSFSHSSASLSSSPQPFQTFVPSLLTPRFLLFSAQFLLFDLYCCPEDLLSDVPGWPTATPKSQASLSMQARTVSGIRETSLLVRDAGLELLDHMVMPVNLARVGPLILDSLYAAMATLHWLWKEGGEGEIKDAFEDVKRVLARLDMRWRLGREYLGMEKYHDVATVGV